MLAYWLCQLCILAHHMHAASPHAVSSICLSLQVMLLCFRQNALQKPSCDDGGVAILLPLAMQ